MKSILPKQTGKSGEMVPISPEKTQDWRAISFVKPANVTSEEGIFGGSCQQKPAGRKGKRQAFEDDSSLRWWFQRFLVFSLTWGKDAIWLICDMFQRGWNHQLVHHYFGTPVAIPNLHGRKRLYVSWEVKWLVRPANIAVFKIDGTPAWKGLPPLH